MAARIGGLEAREQPYHAERDMNAYGPYREIDFGEVIGRVWSRRRLVGALTAGLALLAGSYSLVLPNVYRAEALLMPAANEATNLDSFASNLGGLASLAGINIGRPEGNRATLAIETLKSRLFALRFVSKHGIVPDLVAGDAWTAATDTIVVDPNVYDARTKRWGKRLFGKRSAKPTNTEIYDAFIRRLKVTENNKTGFITVSFDFIAPTYAKRWLDQIIVDLNEFVRERDAEEARRNIAYLEKQLQLTRIAEIQKVFYELLEDQQKVLMLAQSRDQYALKLVDPPIVPDRKIGPRRAQIILAGGLLGLLIGASIALAAPARAAATRTTNAGA